MEFGTFDFTPQGIAALFVQALLAGLLLALLAVYGGVGTRR